MHNLLWSVRAVLDLGCWLSVPWVLELLKLIGRARQVRRMFRSVSKRPDYLCLGCYSFGGHTIKIRNLIILLGTDLQSAKVIRDTTEPGDR